MMFTLVPMQFSVFQQGFKLIQVSISLVINLLSLPPLQQATEALMDLTILSMYLQVMSRLRHLPLKLHPLKITP